MGINTSIDLVAASGMGAAIAQQINGQYAFLCAAIALVVTLAMLIDYRRHKNSGWVVLAAVCLTLLHPIWTVNPIEGDMGLSQLHFSIISTSIIIALMFVMYLSRQNWATAGNKNHESPRSNPNAG